MFRKNNGFSDKLLAQGVLYLSTSKKSLTIHDSSIVYEAMKRLLEEHKPSIFIVDFNDIEFVELPVVGALVLIERKCKAIKCEMIFMNVSAEVLHIFKILGITDSFHIVKPLE